jgi:hypothetical protein
MSLNIAYLVLGYNRPDHLERVLVALKQQPISQLYCYIDKPADGDSKLLDANKRVIELVRAIDWCSVKCVLRDKNWGLAKNLTAGVTDVLSRHDAIVVLEDDCVPQPGFTHYMHTMLTRFRDDRSVRSVCGYTFPCVEGMSCEPAYIMSRFCPWGWATWRDRWRDFVLPLDGALEKLTKISAPLGSVGADVKRYCEDPYFKNAKADIWSLSWIVAHAVDGSACVYPASSLVENIGFDGTGVHSGPTDAFNIKSAISSAWRSVDWDRVNVRADSVVQEQVLEYLEIHSSHAMKLRQHSDLKSNPNS